jgi:hypothetical protein
MKAFKVVILVILGMLLSLSLLVFGFALTLNQSLLSPDFVADHVDSLDVAAVADEAIADQIPAEAADFMGESLDVVLTDTIDDIESWLKEQARDGIFVFYDYLEGRSETLSLTLSLDTVKTSLRENLLAAILASPPPDLVGLTPAQIEAEFNTYWSQIDAEIPSTLVLDETMVDAEVIEQIEQAKQYVGYFNMVFFVLIGFSLLMILLIILTHMAVRGSTRQLGITFLSVGAVSLAGALIARSVIGGVVTGSDIPATLQGWIPQLITDVLMPLGIYSIGLIVVGIVLTIVSFVYKRGEYSDYYY